MKAGVVVIGRNEGRHLNQCLHSLIKEKEVDCMVYVDSGSTDNSLEIADSFKISIVELDSIIPYSAARARNAGLAYLLQAKPDIPFVQFVDGDCEISPGWLALAERELEIQSDLAVVCGTLRERFPNLSVYHQLCAIEWNQPSGEIEFSGGIAMMRVTALQQVGGFNPTLIAGEEPELCYRLRQQEWKIIRLQSDMAWHDAQMTHFTQWWKRSIRSGYAYAQVFWLHKDKPKSLWEKENLSNWFWGLLMPLLTIISIKPTYGYSLGGLLFVYMLLAYKIHKYMQQRNFSSRESMIYALFCVLGKFPNMFGQSSFLINQLLEKFKFI
ncbi:glycosyltransferase family A protein [Microcoleus sp. B3-A4]|uniref:glycosyltransferase family A protein n=1 Tax=Microcoleus sp. B3-A4 TaxID=2818653 RepID=UPI002FCF00C3